LDHDDFQVDYSDSGFDDNPEAALESVVADQDDEAALVDNAQNFVMLVDAALESVDDFPNAAGSAALNDFQELTD